MFLPSSFSCLLSPASVTFFCPVTTLTLSSSSSSDPGDPDGGMVSGGRAASGAGILHPAADAGQGDGCRATGRRGGQDGAFDRAAEGEATHPAGIQGSSSSWARPGG